MNSFKPMTTNVRKNKHNNILIEHSGEMAKKTSLRKVTRAEDRETNHLTFLYTTDTCK